MIARVLITDLTRMSGNHICLAGYRLNGDSLQNCIRPQLDWESTSEPWLYSSEGVLRPFAVARFELLQSRSQPPHTEDWTVRRHYTIEDSYNCELGFRALQSLAVDSISSWFHNSIVHDQGWYVPVGTGDRSLGTFLISRLRNVVYEHRPERAKWEYRLAFDDAVGESFSLSVTDLAFRYYLDCLQRENRMSSSNVAKFVLQSLREAEQVILRIGLTRPFGERHDRCFLQVTGVYTIPDYLDGMCHTDYLPADDSKPIVVPF